MLKNLFVSEVRIKILDLLLNNINEDLHVREIVRRVGAEINAVRRELENLISIGLLTKRQSSNRLYYSVVTDHVFYPELLSMIAKERGVGAEIAKRARNKELGDIEFALLSRTFLRGRDSTSLDVDLFVVGNIDVEALERIIRKYEREMGREINYATMNSEEFRFAKRKSDPFVVRVLSQGKTMLVGDEEKFYAIV